MKWWMLPVLAALSYLGMIHARAAENLKVPASVALLVSKYESARKAALGPVVDAFAEELRTKTVPELTRSGKAETALEISTAAEALKNAPVPLIPRSGSPFSADAFSVIESTTEWRSFTDKFREAETKLNEAYDKALERERTTYLSLGDPHGVLAVDQERKRIEALADGVVPPGNSAPASPENREMPPPAPPSVQASKPAGEKAKMEELEGYLVGKMYEFALASTAERHEYFFRKNGEVVRRITPEAAPKRTDVGEWKIDGDLSVRISGLASPKWFLFDTPESGEMHQGDKGGKTRYKFKRIPGATDPEQ